MGPKKMYPGGNKGKSVVDNLKREREQLDKVTKEMDEEERHRKEMNEHMKGMEKKEQVEHKMTIEEMLRKSKEMQKKYGK